jgi:hypothetical protein
MPPPNGQLSARAAGERAASAAPVVSPVANPDPASGAARRVAPGAERFRRLTRGLRNPRWLAMDLFSRFVGVRDLVAAVAQLRARLPRRNSVADPAGPSLLAPFDPQLAALHLRKDGFWSGLQLPPGIAGELVSFALCSVCHGHSEPEAGFHYPDRARVQAAVGRTFSLATYLFMDEVEPLIARIAADPALLAAVRAYLGVEPVYLGRRLWWTFATPEAQYDRDITTSRFHYDRDDYRSVRVFFYLTEVGDGNGPHVVTRGSHRRKTLRQMLSAAARSDENIVRWYGPENIVTIRGAAGTGFIEDPFCFHKATRPVAGDRLVLELGFGMRNHRVFDPPDRRRIAMIPLGASRS